jgi:hypothetical protein
MSKLDELRLVFTLVDCGMKSITQLELSARKTKCLGRINEAFAAAEEVIDRWGSDIARLGEISYAYCAFTAFVDSGSSCPEQSFTGGVCLCHDDKRNPDYR